MDMIIWATDVDALEAWMKAKWLKWPRGKGEPGWKDRPGLYYSLWGGPGKVLKTRGTYDADGLELTPPVYLDGVYAIFRSQGFWYDRDHIPESEAVEADKWEVWGRSKTAKQIKDEGTAGVVDGISYYELDGIRIVRHQDLLAKIAEWGTPGHSFGSSRYITEPVEDEIV